MNLDFDSDCSNYIFLGFYLINRREINGASTTTPIAMSILINMWPLFVIIALANAYVGVFIWLLDKTLNTGNFSPKFLQGAIEGSWWSYLLFVTNGFVFLYKKFKN